MKQSIAWFIGFMLALAPVAAHAQKQDGSKLGFGAKLGLTVTTIGGADADNIPLTEFEHKVGFALGGLVEIPISSLVSIQVELQYVTKGANVRFLGEEVGYRSLTYLEVPILVRAAFGSDRGPAPFVVLGPGLGILLSADDVDLAGDSENINEDIQDLDVGVILGGGVAIPLGSGGAIEIEARYEHGRMNLDDNPNLDWDLANRAFFILGGYRF